MRALFHPAVPPPVDASYCGPPKIRVYMKRQFTASARGIQRTCSYESGEGVIQTLSPAYTQHLSVEEYATANYEGELRTAWREVGVENVWYMMGSFQSYHA